MKYSLPCIAICLLIIACEPPPPPPPDSQDDTIAQVTQEGDVRGVGPDSEVNQTPPESVPPVEPGAPDPLVTPTAPVCGDGVVQPGEYCDAAQPPVACASLAATYASGTTSCNADCTWDLSGCVEPATCGNGALDLLEDCDDGGNVDGDGCSSTCRSEILASADCGSTEKGSAGGVTGDLDYICEDPGSAAAAIPPVMPLLRVRVHVVATSDGSLQATSLTDVDATMAVANELLGDLGITLVRTEGLDVIPNDVFFNLTDVGRLALMGTNLSPNAIDIYVVNTLVLGGRVLGGVASDIGPAGIPHNLAADSVIVVGSAGGSVLAHEIGHILGLWHTHHPDIGNACSASGDGCCDTPSDPGPPAAAPEGEGTCAQAFPSGQCVATCPDGSTPDVTNVMSYYGCGHVPGLSGFSACQETRASCYAVRHYAYAAVQPGELLCGSLGPNGCDSDTSVTCQCMGCDTDGVCGASDDCVCPDCAADPFCSSPSSCDNDGVCDPHLEGCGCADCASHPECVCVPSCGGIECGSDGCGGSCGVCGIGQACAAGKCECAPIICSAGETETDTDGDGCKDACVAPIGPPSPAWSSCEWHSVSAGQSHNPGMGDWCPDGSFLTQVSLTDEGNFSEQDLPVVGGAHCCFPAAPNNQPWDACQWSEVGVSASHQKTEWCPVGKYLVQFDLDGGGGFAGSYAPIVSQARCCGLANRPADWASSVWEPVGLILSFDDNVEWCPAGAFLTGLDLDSIVAIDPAQSPVIGSALCATPSTEAAQADMPPTRANPWGPAEPGCFRAGCNGQVCSSDPDATSSCASEEWTGCLPQADCGHFGPGGSCAFQSTDEFQVCTDALPTAPPAWGECEWSAIVGAGSHSPDTGDWCADGSFLTQVSLSDGPGLSAKDLPVVGGARCCRPALPIETTWDACEWVDVGASVSHSQVEWCSPGKYLVQLDLDGGNGFSESYGPIVGQARCCGIAGQAADWSTADWEPVGLMLSFADSVEWCSDGAFLTGLDLDSINSIDPAQSPVIGAARCASPAAPTVSYLP